MILRNVDVCHSPGGGGKGGQREETEAYFFLLWIEDDMFYSREAQSSERIIRSLVEV